MSQDVVILGPQDASRLDRANEVRKRLILIRSTLDDNFFDMCELLLEAQEQGYHVVYGYSRFGDWIEQAGLDLSARSAYYLINIAKKARALGLTRAEMKETKISKLKEIFALDPQEHGTEMKQLVASAREDSLEAVKEKVARVRAEATGQQPFVLKTFKLDPNVLATVEEAFELARAQYGSRIENGEEVEASDSQCLEIICIEYLNDPNHGNVADILTEDHEP